MGYGLMVQNSGPATLQFVHFAKFGLSMGFLKLESRPGVSQDFWAQIEGNFEGKLRACGKIWLELTWYKKLKGLKVGWMQSFFFGVMKFLRKTENFKR